MGSPACPDREMLAALAAGNLSGATLEAVAAHIDSCPDCLAFVQGLQPTTDPLLGPLGQPGPADPFLQEPGCAEAVARFEQIPPAGGSLPEMSDPKAAPGGPAHPPIDAGAVPWRPGPGSN